jgi:hypothetical protein
LFFGAIRAALGANNNPTCGQFEHIFKKLLVKLEIKISGGNCRVQVKYKDQFTSCTKFNNFEFDSTTDNYCK